LRGGDVGLLGTLVAATQHQHKHLAATNVIHAPAWAEKFTRIEQALPTVFTSPKLPNCALRNRIAKRRRVMPSRKLRNQESNAGVWRTMNMSQCTRSNTKCTAVEMPHQQRQTACQRHEYQVVMADHPEMRQHLRAQNARAIGSVRGGEFFS
jgi:GrpB-like predicted nucleotidyltransferase (UPF0157 family)